VDGDVAEPDQPQPRAAPWLEVNPGSHEGGQAAGFKPQARKRTRPQAKKI